jgi:cysteinyl-tRNA synthetase
MRVAVAITASTFASTLHLLPRCVAFAPPHVRNGKRSPPTTNGGDRDVHLAPCRICRSTPRRYISSSSLDGNGDGADVDGGGIVVVGDVKNSSSSSSPAPRRLALYNSLTRTKSQLIPLNPPLVTMYTCGPTVYDHAHVGNFRAFLTYDVLKRALTYLGYDVDHICNLTDVDDKIIKRCDREGMTLLELTRKFENKFFDDLDALNIVRAREYPRATDHIMEMAEFILDLEGNGLAYQSDEGSWYFSVSKKEGYGTRLVQLDPDQLKKGASSETGGGGSQRGALDADEYDAEKEGVRDFCLWKAYKPGFDREDATWDPVVALGDGATRNIGRGRPGWHLECSAMARKYLGNTIDLHAGGVDLKFPHHENEIAQSEVRHYFFVRRLISCRIVCLLRRENDD